MSDLQNYISRRKENDQAFAEGFDEGYQSFKVGLLLRQARESLGLTQEEVAARLQVNRSAVVRIENHADRMALSTLEKFALSLGRRLEISIHELG